MHFNALTLISFLSSLASAGTVPQYSGLRALWSDDFNGNSGQPPNQGTWNIITNMGRVNNELQTYTGSNSNLQLSGGGTLQIIPRKSGGAWTSGRIESKAAFTPQANKLTIFEGVMRLGDGPSGQKQGLWPAFWLLGESIHHGTPWPACGELDIMETINGQFTNYGTVHCGSFPGGACNEPIGRAQTFGVSVNDWHTYRLKVDRRAPGGNWQDETIQWEVDGQVFHTLRGSDIGEEGVWATLARSPMFMILNVAVGGDWPGAPNGATGDGYDSMLEAEYVAVYST
ncbi:concanavalin A-like lectin/glucanase domain-containing protein [Cladorrhinum samala]|uniref:Concanavalin A-like lectin/glucanase domain-containing protein n=1 Tax=Cladorrhinum samala TaxID=585594 RepID=A0AAV9I2B3_9PEZI|nr:concanavalin A-like lectin/glucanase domain-containing protein [Cladorrhinum samala]